MGRIIIIVVTIALLLGCASKQKISYSEEQMNQIHQLMADKSFEIDSQWAYPLATNALNSIANAGLLQPGSTANSINLIGNPNYFRLVGDSISAYLPYYGERLLSAPYGTRNSGIEFDGKSNDIKIDFNEDKNHYVITLTAKQENESLNFRILIFPNLKSTIYINSSHRRPISYSGTISALKEDNLTMR